VKTDGPLPVDERRWPALDAARLNGALAARPALWREVRVVEETRSTNADLMAEARSGAREGQVLVAEAQTGGRGRMGRRWISPPRSALTFSVLLRPTGVPAGLLGWVPLLAGVAVASALAETAGVDARLKWPNDVLADGNKLAGILAERWGEAVVVGTGINVFQGRDELPVPTATSVLLAAPAASAGVDVRERLLTAVLGELARWYRAWLDQPHPGDTDGCGLREEYLRRSGTVGAMVTVMLPGGQHLTGTAVGIDPAGRLELRTPAGLVQVSAGDVVHLRRADTAAAQ
jgi:BirA family transcriptional regulator, biotin operon repressor / biotin---[acetyl-CoA-carboxylase] ligase